MNCEDYRIKAGDADRPEQHRTPAAVAQRQRGFTLLEIMVVVVIIGIMASFVLPKVFGNVEKVNRVKAFSDFKAIGNALEMYQLDNFSLPSSDEGLQALTSPPRPDMRKYQKGGYISSEPTDPWGKPYIFANPGEHGEYDIYTLGRDGQVGGEGPDEDLGNWMKN